MSENVTEKKKNRKRKKTFLQNARKYAKKGYFGRGSHMDADTYQYFVRILEVYNQGFENKEDKEAFVSNVFEQTVDKEIDCSCNQVGCRVIEMLLPFASDEVLERFMNKFSEDIRPLSQDRFAGFVLQALVIEAFRKSLDSNNDKSGNYREFALRTSKFLLNNLEDYIWDNFGNRVIRTCLCGLMQIPEESRGKEKRPTINSIENEESSKDATDIPEEYVEVVKEYGERLIVWPQFGELCTSDLTSGFLQVLLKALNKADTKLLKKYFDKLLQDIFSAKDEESKEKLPPGFMSTSLLMLLESCLQLAGKKMFNVFLEKLFTGRMAKLACLKSTSFAVQKALAGCRSKEQFDPLFDEISEHFADILEKGHPAVLMAMCQTCKRLSTKQGYFVQNMMKALNCFEPEERQNHFVISMCRLAPYNPNSKVNNENIAKEKLNLQGTLMLQLLLEYNKPIKIVNSILSMDANDLKNLFSNSMGSHVVDSYVKSVFVGEKSREKLIRKMKGTYQDLATSKYGSRSFEAIWNVAGLNFKSQIMEELSYKDGSWSNSECGKIIAFKVNLNLFKTSKEQWKNSLNKVAKPEEVLADVLR